jgi:hypothetical protein
VVHHVLLPKKTPIKLLFQAFCKKRRLITGVTCFLFKGKPLSGELSADELGMTDHDTIDVTPLTINLMSEGGADASSSERIDLQVSGDIVRQV